MGSAMANIDTRLNEGQASKGLSLAAAKDYIRTFDLRVVHDRLVKIDKWPPNQATEACNQYRNFLFLKKKYGSQYELPPSYDMDEVWHAHILHTKDYMEFCDHVYGEFLHHQPHEGDGGSARIAELNEIFESQTQRLYQLEFGTPIYAVRVSFRILLQFLWNRLIHAKLSLKKPYRPAKG